MVNVYVRVTPNGCVIQKAGEETCFTDLRTARSQNHDAADAFAQLRKLERLVEDGSLRFQSSYPITHDTRALTGEYTRAGCTYQIAVFLGKSAAGEETVKSLQTFPLQGPHTDVHISDPTLLAFLSSSQLFVKNT